MATGVEIQSGTPSAEVAGMILSHLAVHPEHVERFMQDGVEMLLDGTIGYRTGCLSYLCKDGAVRTAMELRHLHGEEQ